MVSGRRSIQRGSYCCPNCKYEILSSIERYENHGVCAEGNTVRTPKGVVRVTIGQMGVLLALLEVYPRTVTEITLSEFYEFYMMHYNTDGDGLERGIIPVQISHMRKSLLSVGLVIANVWGKGWFLKMDFTEAANVSVPA